MATQTLEFNATTGLTITAKLFAQGSDTQTASVTATEQTNRKGRYTAAFTDVAAGAYNLIAFVGSTGGFANEVYDMTLTTATFYPRSEQAASSGGLDAAGVRAAVGLASANLDTQLSGLSTSLTTIEGTGFDISTDGLAQIREAVDAMVGSVAPITESGVTPGSFNMHAGVDFSRTFSVTLPSNWSKLYFTIKNKPTDADSSAILQILLTNPANGTNDGLQILNGASSTKANASMSVNAGRTAITVTVKAAATLALKNRADAWYDFKTIGSDNSVPYLADSGRALFPLLVTNATT